VVVGASGQQAAAEGGSQDPMGAHGYVAPEVPTLSNEPHQGFIEDVLNMNRDIVDVNAPLPAGMTRHGDWAGTDGDRCWASH
jgi:hypothetical protein